MCINKNNLKFSSDLQNDEPQLVLPAYRLARHAIMVPVDGFQAASLQIKTRLFATGHFAAPAFGPTSEGGGTRAIESGSRRRRRWGGSAGARRLAPVPRRRPLGFGERPQAELFRFRLLFERQERLVLEIGPVGPSRAALDEFGVHVQVPHVNPAHRTAIAVFVPHFGPCDLVVGQIR